MTDDYDLGFNAGMQKMKEIVKVVLSDTLDRIKGKPANEIISILSQVLREI